MATSSEKYWSEREAEAHKHHLTDEEEYEKQLLKIQLEALDNIQKEINSFFGRYAEKEGITIAEARKRADRLDIEAYERKAKRYVAEKDFSDRANEEMRLYNLTMKVNRLELLKANIGLELISSHNAQEKLMADILQGRTIDELKRQAGILGKTVKDNHKLAKQIVNSSHYNANFSDRIWMYQDLMKADLTKLLTQGLVQGKGVRQLSKELEKYYKGNPQKDGGAIYSAKRLMQTELARVQVEANIQSYIEMGFDMYTFHANSGCCDRCKPLHGKHFKISELKYGVNAPPIHPNCRCATSPYEDDDEYEAWIDFLSKGGTTVDWKKFERSAAKGAGIVSSLNSYEHNNVEYQVDGKHIVLDYTEKEVEIAELLARELLTDVQMVPRIAYPQNISTPDFLVGGIKFDLKQPEGSGKNVLYGMLQKKKRQASNFVFDISKCPLSVEEIDRQAKDIYRSRNMRFVEQIVIVKDGKIINIYNRKK